MNSPSPPGYGITLKRDAKEPVAYLLGLLNSRLLDFYLKHVSTTMRGGYFRYFTQFLEQLPIRRMTPKTNAKLSSKRKWWSGSRPFKPRIADHEAAGSLQPLDPHTQNRTACHLAHYLQKGFAAVVEEEGGGNPNWRRAAARVLFSESPSNRTAANLHLNHGCRGGTGGGPHRLPVLRPDVP